VIWTASGDGEAREAAVADGRKPERAAGRSAQSLDPVRGSEASRTRPAVALSNDATDETSTWLGRGVTTVVPIARPALPAA
jgi:hypothetical protein